MDDVAEMDGQRAAPAPHGVRLDAPLAEHRHDHVFLGAGHAHAERRTWIVIWLSATMMVLEVVGGTAFGSIGLVADGMHMSTHAGAMLLAALSYRYARRHAADPRFSFGTGKLSDLAGFTSAIVLAMIAALIGYEAIGRLLAPIHIRFAEAIPIACLGLVVNLVSAALLMGGSGPGHKHGVERHDPAHRDNNMRAIMFHIMTDAAVTVVVIVCLLLARRFGWLWMDPVGGLFGFCVIGVWSVRLLAATGAILLDMVPDHTVAQRLKRSVEEEGDLVTDLHVWRLGPGHLGAIISISTGSGRDTTFHRERLLKLGLVSHLTVEVLCSRLRTGTPSALQLAQTPSISTVLLDGVNPTS